MLRGLASLAGLMALNGPARWLDGHRVPVGGGGGGAGGASGARGAGAAGAAGTGQPAAAGSAAEKLVFIGADDHTDYLWSADEEEYRRAFLRMLDYHLDRIDATEHLPQEHHARWNCDGSLWVWEYERHRGPAEFDRLIDRIRDGHVSVPLNPLVICPGGAPAEAVLRGMYYAGRLERRHGLRLPLAIAMENQTLPAGLASLFAGSGARYSWKGVCGCSTRVTDLEARRHEIYWWQGPDGRRLLMKWYSLLADNRGPGGYAEAGDPERAVGYVTEHAVESGFRARYPYDVIGLFGQGWDGLETLNDDVQRAAVELTDPTRRLVVSNCADFFEAFLERYGDELPVETGALGNEWDLLVASMQGLSGRVKRAAERLRAAEAMQAVVELAAPGTTVDDIGERDAAYMALGLYYEHDWTADGPVGHDARREWQRRTGGEVIGYVDRLHGAARTGLGRAIGLSAAAAPTSAADTDVARPRPRARPRAPDAVSFFAFNALGWARDGVAELPAAELGDEAAGWITYGTFRVVDAASGAEVPSQVGAGTAGPVVKAWATDVPAMGYRVFHVRPGSGRVWEPAAATSDAGGGALALICDRFQIEVAPRGAIARLLDRTRGNRDVVGTIDGMALNDLRPFAGAGAGTAAEVVVEAIGPVTAVLIARVEGGPLPRTTRVAVDRGGAHVAIENSIDANFSRVHTWEYCFDAPEPRVWHEELGAVLLARYEADGGGYARHNARADWLTLNHFAAIEGGGSCAVLSNADAHFFRLGASTPGLLDTDTPRLSVLAGGQVDGTHLGIRDQGGDERFDFRFALRLLPKFDAPAAMRFALEHQNPLVAGRVAPDGAAGGLPAERFGLLAISGTDALLWALKIADDGPAAGLAARVWNLAPRRTDVDLSLTPPFSIGRAERTTHIETPIEAADIAAGALRMQLSAHSMETYRLQVARRKVGSGQAVALPYAMR